MTDTDSFHFGGPTAQPAKLTKVESVPQAALDMPGEAGDEAAQMEYIAGKNSTPAERERLHKGANAEEVSYDPGYEPGELGHLEREKFAPHHKLSRHASDE